MLRRIIQKTHDVVRSARDTLCCADEASTDTGPANNRPPPEPDHRPHGMPSPRRNRAASTASDGATSSARPLGDRRPAAPQQTDRAKEATPEEVPVIPASDRRGGVDPAQTSSASHPPGSVSESPHALDPLQTAAPQQTDRAKEASPEEVPVILAPLLKSGGIRNVRREDGQETAATFLVRQNPAQFPKNTEEWEPGDKEPWSVFNSKMTREQLRNYKPETKSPYVLNVDHRTNFAGKKAKAKRDGHVRGPGYYSQVKVGSGDWDLVAHKNYLPLQQIVPFGSCSGKALPTQQIELYQYTYGVVEASKEADAVPAEVLALPILPRGKGSAEPLGQHSYVTKAADVDCHDVDGKYWVFRARQQPPEGKKRRVTVSLHGREDAKRPAFKIPEGKDAAFFGPSGKELLSPDPLLAQDLSPASVHQVRDGEHRIEIYLPVPEGLDDDDLFEMHAGSAGPGGVVEIETAKFNYSHGPDKKAVDALHNLKQAAAWLAFESGNDVVLVRKSRSPRFDSSPVYDGTLSELVQSLDDNGLTGDYEGFDFLICRTDEQQGLQSHRVIDNPARGTEPVALVTKKLDDAHHRGGSKEPALDP